MPEIISCMAEVTSKNTISNALFPKAERLCKKRDIEQLFHQGKIFRADDLKVFYQFIKDSNSTYPCKVLISVPKKQQPLAVNRNKIKRLIREVWRKNNAELNQALIQNDSTLQLAFICFAPKIPTYKEIESKIILTLQHLNNTLSKTQ